jgi:predicted DNA-binding protein (MmcQ/YjbR family)
MWRMTWDELLAYCLAKPGAWQDEPWEGDVVAKVGQKVFAFLGQGTAGRDGLSVGLKCGASREAADEWLLRFPADASVMRYIGRSGWNTLALGGGIPDDEICEAVDVSYAMVVAKLPKRDRPASLASLGANNRPGNVRIEEHGGDEPHGTRAMARAAVPPWG